MNEEHLFIRVTDFKATLYFALIGEGGKYRRLLQVDAPGGAIRGAMQGLYTAESMWADWKDAEFREVAANRLVSAMKAWFVEVSKHVDEVLPTPADIDRILEAAEVHES